MILPVIGGRDYNRSKQPSLYFLCQRLGLLGRGALRLALDHAQALADTGDEGLGVAEARRGRAGAELAHGGGGLVEAAAAGRDAVEDEGDGAAFLAGEVDGGGAGPDVERAGLDGDEDEVGGADGALGLALGVGGRVDEDEVVLALEAVELDAEAPAADHGEAELGGGLGAVLAAAHPGGEAGLGIDVDEGDAVAGGAERGGELDDQRGLAGAALLLRHGDDGGGHGQAPGLVTARAVDGVEEGLAGVEAA